VLESQLTILFPLRGHKVVVLEQGDTGIFIDYEAGANDAYEGHGSIAALRCEAVTGELTDEPNLNAYGFTPV